MGQTVSVQLDQQVLDQLNMMAKAADHSRAWLMSQAITQYVAHEAWQIEAIKQSLIKLENDDSKFTSHDDVKQWLSSWGTDDETECPNS